MNMNRRAVVLAIVFSLVCFLSVASAQQAPAPAPAPAQSQDQKSELPVRELPSDAPQVGAEAVQGGHANLGFGKQLAKESKEAAGEEDETKQFKLSPSVRWLADKTGLSPEAASWAGIVLNFAILALLLALLLKKNIPAAFRARTESIRKGIDEGQRASADANRRLAEVEARLSRLNDEIASMRTAADKEAAAEEARIIAASEEDKNKIVESAQLEIEAAAKSARRELKAYAAELAVTLAEKRIHVDSLADQALVRSFTEQLGKDGQ